MAKGMRYLRRILNPPGARDKWKYIYKEAGKVSKRSVAGAAKPATRKVATTATSAEKRLAHTIKVRAWRAARKAGTTVKAAPVKAPVKAAPKEARILTGQGYRKEVDKADARFDSIVNKNFRKPNMSGSDIERAGVRTDAMINRRTDAMNKPEKLEIWGRKLEFENYHSSATRALAKASALRPAVKEVSKSTAPGMWGGPMGFSRLRHNPRGR